jgi:peptidoglycan/LPS O-acetylase OafA/YrhL
LNTFLTWRAAIVPADSVFTKKAATVTGHSVPDAPPEGTNLSYIPALDGVRAVAMLAIMAYHGGVILTNGGFYSVDTFFALSGFLITSLLLTEWRATATLRLRAFWARRARRLVPGLLLLLLGLAAYNAVMAPAGAYPNLRGDALSALFYVSNWHFILAGSNYFNQTGATSPLLHTWTLAIEEQFYVLWPLIVLATLKIFRRLRVLFVICVVGALASAAEMAILYSPGSRSRVYFGTDTHAQSLLVGAALAVGVAMWTEHRRRVGSPREASVSAASSNATFTAETAAGRRFLIAVGWIGVAGTAALWAFVNFNMALAFRGGFLLAAIAASAVLLSVTCVRESLLARCLSIRPLRYLGRISYGMYLWHFPLFQYLDHARTHLDPYPLLALRVAVTIVFATVSFYVVERPIRRGTFLRGWRTWVATPAAVGVTVVALLASTSALPATALVVTPKEFKPPAIRDTGIYAGPPVRVLLVGDSTAYTLDTGLARYEKAYDVVIRNGAILGCGVTSGQEYELKGVDSPMDSACNGSHLTEQWPQVWRAHENSFRPNVVMILAGRWEVVNRTFEGKWTNILNPKYAAYVKQQLRLAIRVAGASGARVALLTAPCYDTGEQPDGSPWPEDMPNRLAKYNDIARQVAETSRNATLINFNAMACPQGHYESYVEGVDARYDGVHFTLAGGIVFESRIFPTVVSLGRKQMQGSG